MAIKIAAPDGTTYEFDTVEEARVFTSMTKEAEGKDPGLTKDDLEVGATVRFVKEYEDRHGDTAIKGVMGEVRRHTAEYVVIETDIGLIYVEFGDIADTLTLVETDADEEEDESQSFEVGDRVRVVNAKKDAGYYHSFDKGVEGRIEDIRPHVQHDGIDTPYRIKLDGANIAQSLAAKDIVLVGEEHVREYETDESKFASGDIAKLSSLNKSTDRRFEVGDLVTVEDPKWPGKHEILISSGYYIGFVDAHQLEKVPDESSEYKAGDKVRLIDNESPILVFSEVGAIGTVVEGDRYADEDELLVEIENYGGGDTQYVGKTQVELVKPLAKDVNGEDLYEGDYVTGVDSVRYGYTTDKALMTVAGGATNGFDDIRVDVIEHVEAEFVGRTHVSVQAKYFVKTTEEEFDAKKDEYIVPKTSIKKGDKVIALEDGHDIHSRKFKLTDEPTPKYEVGDVVYVKESFTDTFEDRADEGFAEVISPETEFMNLVIMPGNGDPVQALSNVDKLTLVCRAEDRLDKDGE